MAERDRTKEDEVINVMMSRKDYEVLRQMIEREEAFTWFKGAIRSWILWTMMGGIISMVTLWDKFKLWFQ